MFRVTFRICAGEVQRFLLKLKHLFQFRCSLRIIDYAQSPTLLSLNINTTRFPCKEKMSLWVDKYRPKQLQKLDYHTDQAAHLKKIVSSGDFPHLLVYGPPGAGKKTRVMCILRELYGSGVEKLRIEHQAFTTPSNRKLEIVTVASNYHIEVNPSDVGIYDRVVIQELIKTVAQTQQLSVTGQREFKVVVLTEVDKLTKDAQHALRRTMEKYIASCRLILIANSTSKVIGAIRSRCLGVRVAAPSNDEIIGILQAVCKKEGLSLPLSLAEKIAEKSGRNLRRALLMCEASRVAQYPFKSDQEVSEPDWETFLKETGQKIVREQSVRCLVETRARLYELLTHCIPPEVIFRGLLKEMVSSCDNQLKCQVVELAATYEHRLRKGSKVVFHLEAFVAKFMSIYAHFIEAGFADADFDEED